MRRYAFLCLFGAAGLAVVSLSVFVFAEAIIGTFLREAAPRPSTATTNTLAIPVNLDGSNYPIAKSAMTDSTLATQLVIAGAIARLSSVLLLTFGVRVFLHLYSYHVRLAVFYAARADALAILGATSLDDLEQLVTIISPECITFDKTPEAGLELNDVVKAVLQTKAK